MRSNEIAFEILEENNQPPPGWHKVISCLVFDEKIYFTWVLYDHKTPDPVESTYAGLVSRKSVRTGFTFAALNGLDVFDVDIRNIYLHEQQSQKGYIICDPELGLKNVGKVALIHRWWKQYRP